MHFKITTFIIFLDKQLLNNFKQLAVAKCVCEKDVKTLLQSIPETQLFLHWMPPCFLTHRKGEVRLSTTVHMSKKPFLMIKCYGCLYMPVARKRSINRFKDYLLKFDEKSKSTN